MRTTSLAFASFIGSTLLAAAPTAAQLTRGRSRRNLSPKSPSSGKSKRSGGKGSSKGPCVVAGDFEAAAIGTKLLADFWADITATGCKTSEISKVYDKYYDEDATVSLGFGSPLMGADAIKEFFVDSDAVANFCTDRAVSYVGLSSTAVVDGDTIHWHGNQVVSPYVSPSPFPGRGLEYTIVLDEKCKGTIIAQKILPTFPIETDLYDCEVPV